jgi:hypothetical protein
MRIKKKVLLFIITGLLMGSFNVDIASAKYNWADYFSKNEMKSIKKAVKKSIRNELKHPDKKWKGIINQKVLKEGGILDYSKLNLTNSILVGDLAANGCVNGQVLKYNGSAWVCGADDNTGSTLGNSVESAEITDDTIVNSDINAAAAIDYSKLSLIDDITSLDIAQQTITNVDISDTAAIDAYKINFDTNGEHDLGAGTDIIGFNESKINFSGGNSTSCSSGGDCISMGSNGVGIYSYQNSSATDSVEIIRSCTDSAEYSCSTNLDNRPVIRFYDDKHDDSNILIGSNLGSKLLIEDGNGDRGDIQVGGLFARTASIGLNAIGGYSAEYLRFKNTSAGAPPAGDCDDDSERGRMSIDTTNNRLYICNGATRGWDYTSMID